MSLSSLCTAAKREGDTVAHEVVQGLISGGAPSPAPVKVHTLTIDGCERGHIHVLKSSRAAQLLDEGGPQLTSVPSG